MKIIPHNRQMLKEAREWASSVGGIKNSITKGEGNIAGRLGELAVSKYLGVPIEDAVDYDLIYKGERLEVKTIRRSVPPKPSYAANVSISSAHQSPDRYVFVSIEYDKRVKGKYVKLLNVWLCGDKDAEEYMEQAYLEKRGKTNPFTGFVALRDQYVVEIKDLDQSF